MANEIPVEQLEQDLELLEKGRLLLPWVKSPAWEIVKDTIRAQVDDVDEQLRGIEPGNPRVPQVHAALYALSQFSDTLIRGIEDAAMFAQNPSPEVKEYVHQVMTASDVKRAMEF